MTDINSMEDWFLYLDSVGNPKVIFLDGPTFWRMFCAWANLARCSYTADGPVIDFLNIPNTQVRHKDWPKERPAEVDLSGKIFVPPAGFIPFNESGFLSMVADRVEHKGWVYWLVPTDSIWQKIWHSIPPARRYADTESPAAESGYICARLAYRQSMCVSAYPVGFIDSLKSEPPETA